MGKIPGITILIAALGWFLFCFSPAAAETMYSGTCIDCHTSDNPLSDPDDPSLRQDCVDCHAMGTAEKIVEMADGTLVPQVYHTDENDLAGGNFAYISGHKPGEGEPGSRKGHDVVDLGFRDDVFSRPPGFKHAEQPHFFPAGTLTCAGANGCHGIRNQLLPDETTKRTGLEALSGAHHANEEGALEVADTAANSYRFLLGVRGLENPDPLNRWRNASRASHNEYFGAADYPFRTDGDDNCFTCHGGSTEPTTSSFITAPGNSMSGFCATCHRYFHDTSAATTTFLRHPSDFVIKNQDEYGEYTRYELTAPVARPFVPASASSAVQPGRDMVMCLSCHLAHAGPYDAMLRFDYSKMTAGQAGKAARSGCFACHPWKGR